jgi:hypothetical protein
MSRRREGKIPAIPADVETALSLLRLQVEIDAPEIAVLKRIQQAIDQDYVTNPPGARLPASAVLKALRELPPGLVRQVLWPGSPA